MLQPKIITTMQSYDGPTFRADAVAGVTVAMVAIPLSIAIAIASGARPMDGLIIAVAIGSGLAAALDLPVDTIASRYGALRSGLPLPHLPAISLARIDELIPPRWSSPSLQASSRCCRRWSRTG